MIVSCHAFLCQTNKIMRTGGNLVSKAFAVMRPPIALYRLVYAHHTKFQSWLLVPCLTQVGRGLAGRCQLLRCDCARFWGTCL